MLLELRKTNNEILENQNSGDYALKDSEPFKKHYATVLVQLKEASGQACGFHHYISFPALTFFYLIFISNLSAAASN